MFERREVDAQMLGLRRPGTYELWGELPPPPRVAVVGSRAALHVLTALVEPAVTLVSARGYAVVSGGAMGIDAAVHRAALAFDVPQVAVLPCGADRLYPPAHAQLFEQVAHARQSGVLFAQPRGTTPSRAMFVSRNAITVQLAEMCLVVQAESRSGSETTGRLALRSGRRVAAVVGTPGCNALVAAGATPIVPDLGQLTAQLSAWLAQTERVVQWPAHLWALRDAFHVRGPHGASLDQLGGPQAAVALFEAVALGLVIEGSEGRWTALR